MTKVGSLRIAFKTELTFCTFQEENGAAWISWLLDAIHKIKVQNAINIKHQLFLNL